MPFTKTKPTGLNFPSGPLTDPILVNAIHHIFGEDTPPDFIDRYFLGVSREARLEKLIYLAFTRILGLDGIAGEAGIPTPFHEGQREQRGVSPHLEGGTRRRGKR